LLFAPTLTPFNFHWYAGAAPPFKGLAVNVTLEPAQIAVADAVISTDGVSNGLTVTATVFDTTTGEVTQPAFEVISQVTWSPLVNPVVE
jgi:hypothetical protein